MPHLAVSFLLLVSQAGFLHRSTNARLGNKYRAFFTPAVRDTAIQDAAPGEQGQACSKPSRGFRSKATEKQP